MTEEEQEAALITMVLYNAMQKAMLKTIVSTVKQRCPTANDKHIYMQLQRSMATEHIGLDDLRRTVEQ